LTDNCQPIAARNLALYLERRYSQSSQNFRSMRRHIGWLENMLHASVSTNNEG